MTSEPHFTLTESLEAAKTLVYDGSNPVGGEDLFGGICALLAKKSDGKPVGSGLAIDLPAVVLIPSSYLSQYESHYVIGFQR